MLVRWNAWLAVFLACSACPVVEAESRGLEVLARGEVEFLVPQGTGFLGSIQIDATDEENWTACIVGWEGAFLSVVRVEVGRGHDPKVTHVALRSSPAELELLELAIGDAYVPRIERDMNPFLALLTFEPGGNPVSFVIAPHVEGQAGMVRVTLDLLADPPVASAAALPQTTDRVHAFSLRGNRTAVLFEQPSRMTPAIVVTEGGEIVHGPARLVGAGDGGWSDVVWLDDGTLALVGEADPGREMDWRASTGSMRLATARYSLSEGLVEQVVHADLPIQANGTPYIVGPLTAEVFHVLVDRDADFERVELALVRVEGGEASVVATFDPFERTPLFGNPSALAWQVDGKAALHFLHVPFEVMEWRLAYGRWEAGGAGEVTGLTMIDAGDLADPAGFGLVGDEKTLVAWLRRVDWQGRHALEWAVVGPVLTGNSTDLEDY